MGEDVSAQRVPDATEGEAKPIPGFGDREVRRYRIFSFDFDSRPQTLTEAPTDQWDSEARELWEQSRVALLASLRRQYGEDHFERKVEDFAAFGAKPFSIIAHHNALFEDVRTAFVNGAYYAALTSACTLGERILNHLMLDLRDHFRSTPEYRSVYRKASFDRWSVAIDTLVAWDVMLPDVASEYRSLERLRNRSVHFNADTIARLREDALKAAQLLKRIIDGQFSAFGLQPWFIAGTLGAGFIKREWEDRPFVRHYYLANNLCVGPFHSIELTWDGQHRFVDYPDYGAFCVDRLTDDQFRDLFNNCDQAARARSAVAIENEGPVPAGGEMTP